MSPVMEIAYTIGFSLLFKQTIAGRGKLTITLNTLFHGVEELL